MNLRQYIANAEKTYSYRIKTVVPLSDDAMGRIERVILKYQPVDLSAPRKTMMQKNPLDFPTVGVAEVHIVDAEFGLPASPAQLQMELVKALGIPEKFLVVRGDNDPMEHQSEEIVAKAEMDEAEKDAKPGSLLELPEYEEAEPVEGKDLYGDDYNKRFLGYLKTVADERREQTKVDSPNAPFKWLDMPKPDVDADEGPSIGSEAGSVADERVSSQGNLDDNKRTYTQVYQKKGKVYVKRETNDPIRKDK
ncbi:MAG: hypothetical protein EOP83_14325 [Verrucomicrobiaceae bacterium]|nr:MAG: hypothetical protein EOP83_14325 [Verrucomicrobiaceae bacterium]